MKVLFMLEIQFIFSVRWYSVISIPTLRHIPSSFLTKECVPLFDLLNSLHNSKKKNKNTTFWETRQSTSIHFSVPAHSRIQEHFLSSLDLTSGLCSLSHRRKVCGFLCVFLCVFMCNFQFMVLPLRPVWDTVCWSCPPPCRPRPPAAPVSSACCGTTPARTWW